MDDSAGGRARSAFPGYWPLSCGECYTEVFREATASTGSRFKLYIGQDGKLFAAFPSGQLEEIKGGVVCVTCEESEEGAGL